MGAPRPFPIASETAGSTLPIWLIPVRAKQAAARRVREAAAAYREASGGRAASPAAKRGRTARPFVPVERVGLSLDEVNAALQLAVDHDFLASRSEAAFCQAGVVAPPDSLTNETSDDSGEAG